MTKHNMFKKLDLTDKLFSKGGRNGSCKLVEGLSFTINYGLPKYRICDNALAIKELNYICLIYFKVVYNLQPRTFSKVNTHIYRLSAYSYSYYK